MKPYRPHLVIGLIGLAFLGAILMVHAQDRPGWAPPKVLAPVAETKYPNQIVKKSKPADPGMIVPPTVYEEPRPIEAPKEITPGIVQTAAQLPPPNFPAVEPAMKEAPGPVLAPLPPPVLEPKAPLPLPAPEPTKMLIVDAPALEPVKSSALPPLVKQEPSATMIVGDPPALEPAKIAPPAMPLPKPEPIAPLVPSESSVVEPVQKIAPLPAVKEPIAPMLVVDPPVVEPAKIAPPPMPAPLVPAVTKPEARPAPVVTMPASEPPAVDRPKSFVRIRPSVIVEPGPVLPTPAPAPIQPPSLQEMRPGPLTPPPPPPLAPTPGSGALLHLQTPGVIVEKRGPESLAAGETQLYQIVVRNVGTIAAQQIRIEDDLPAGVRILAADPMPTQQGARAAWMLPALSPAHEHVLKMTLKADANVQLANSTSVHVSAMNVTTRVAAAPASVVPGGLTIRVTGPERIVVGGPAVFDVHVSNQTGQPLTNIVLHADLPPELVMQVRDDAGVLRNERQIVGPIEGMVIAPGEFKILKMPTTAFKAGRSPLQVKVVTKQTEASAVLNVDVAGEVPFLQQTPTTRLMPGRDGDLRIELANHTGKPMKNVTVANVLPEGVAFVAASDRGLYQSNSRTLHWFLEALPVGATKTLHVRVNGAKAGQFANHVLARADGVTEVRSTGTLIVEGIPDLSLKVKDRDNPLELGRETVYEILVQNPGSAPASNVKIEVQFPAGLTPKSAQGNTKHSLDAQSVVFEPIGMLAPQGQAIYRVSALAQTAGLDQRVRFSVVSDEVKTPLQREISVVVYSGN